jgi:hypothetical protein
MSIHKLIDVVAEHSGNIVFIKFRPEIFDFTDKDSECEVEFFFQDGTTMQAKLTDDNFPLVMSVFKITVFSKGRKLLVWNFKQFCTFVLAKTGSTPHVEASIIDLKVIESYAGHRNESPKSFPEAMNRLRVMVQSGAVKEGERVYKNIHLPLMTKVLPRIEAAGLISRFSGNRVHAYYEIDGQENGRLRCHDAFKRGFVPHAMKPETKEDLMPLSQEQMFMSFDFRGMEAYMLSHLSGDDRLRELCRSSDIYCGLHEAIYGAACEENSQRELAKKTFLPVIYGQGPGSLASSCSIPLDVAEAAVKKVRSVFPTALSFVTEHERQLSDKGCVRDMFGKTRRNFPEGKDYLARNFAVQAPAATVCLEKLINLYFSLEGKADIAYTVHDGYVVFATKENWREVFATANGILTAESDMCPGLKLKVSCKAGRKLNDLKSIRKKE